MSEQETCQNCRFWDPVWKFKRSQKYKTESTDLEISNPRMTGSMRKQSDKGLCRRYAPQASALTTVWMETSNGDWCGDYQVSPSGGEAEGS